MANPFMAIKLDPTGTVVTAGSAVVASTLAIPTPEILGLPVPVVAAALIGAIIFTFVTAPTKRPRAAISIVIGSFIGIVGTPLLMDGATGFVWLEPLTRTKPWVIAAILGFVGNFLYEWGTRKLGRSSEQKP